MRHFIGAEGPGSTTWTGIFIALRVGPKHYCRINGDYSLSLARSSHELPIRCCLMATGLSNQGGHTYELPPLSKISPNNMTGTVVLVVMVNSQL